jgi:glycerol-3-phosphate dehydrogenase
VAADPALGAPLAPGQPHLRAEAVYAVRHEMALTVDDVLTRRTRIRLFDRRAAMEAAHVVADLMAAELGWSAEETEQQVIDFMALCAAEQTAGASA